MENLNNTEYRDHQGRRAILKRLEIYAKHLHKMSGDYGEVFDSPDHGLEFIFDGLLTWTFNVKVRRPWRILGTVTDEKHEIFQRSIRSHITTSHLAEALIDPKLDQSLGIECELVDYFHNIDGPDHVFWPRSIYDLEKDDGDWPDFLQTDSSSANLDIIVAPDEAAVLISRSIKGFEGREGQLASIHRRKEAFLDGSSWEQDAWLRDVILKSSPTVLFDGVELSAEDQRWLLEKAAELLPNA